MADRCKDCRFWGTGYDMKTQGQERDGKRQCWPISSYENKLVNYDGEPCAGNPDVWTSPHFGCALFTHKDDPRLADPDPPMDSDDDGSFGLGNA